CSVNRSAWGPNSDASVPIFAGIQNSRCEMQTGGDSKPWGESAALFAVVATRATEAQRHRGQFLSLSLCVSVACGERTLGMDALFEFCILLFELSMSLQVRHRLSLVVRMRADARRVPGFLAELRDQRIALVNQFLTRTPPML